MQLRRIHESLKLLEDGVSVDLPSPELFTPLLAEAFTENRALVAAWLSAVLLSDGRSQFDRNSYFCKIIALLEAERDAEFIFLLSLDALLKLVKEKDYIPQRDVPVAVDYALRFRVADRGKANRILSAYVRRITNEVQDYEDHISLVLFILTCPDIESFISEENRHRILSRWFPHFTYNQLNRIFDHSVSPANYDWFRAFIKSTTDFTLLSDQGLLNAFLLASIEFVQLAIGLREEIERRYLSQRQDSEFIDDFRFFSGGLQVSSNAICAPSKAVSRQKKKPRVAFCVSGQMRGFQEAFGTWHSALRLDEVEAVFFIHTWRSIGRKEITPHHSYRNFYQPFAETFQSVFTSLPWSVERHPHLADLFSRGAQVDVESIFKIYKPAALWLDDDNILGDRASNQEKMYYKMQKCYELSSLDFAGFDLIVRIRPDKKLFPHGKHFEWNSIIADCHAGIVFSDFAPLVRLHQGISIGDQMIVAAPNDARQLFRAWEVTREAQGRRFRYFPSDFRPHATIGTIALASGLRVMRMPGLVFTDKALCDPERLSPELVLQSLRRDAEGRWDNYDRRLIESAERTVYTLSEVGGQ